MNEFQMEAEREMWDAAAASDPGRPAVAEKPRGASSRPIDTWAEHYSPRNVMTLLAAGATNVAGYREWQALGRQVRKGEHGIPLMAPVVVKDRETGEPRMVNTRTVTVFDITQTDPKEA